MLPRTSASTPPRTMTPPRITGTNSGSSRPILEFVKIAILCIILIQMTSLVKDLVSSPSSNKTAATVVIGNRLSSQQKQEGLTTISSIGSVSSASATASTIGADEEDDDSSVAYIYNWIKHKDDPETFLQSTRLRKDEDVGDKVIDKDTSSQNDVEGSSTTEVSFTNSTTTTTMLSKWENKFNIVHVVHTRFMQRQPHLKHLGNARLGLFRAITLPSMKHQSTSEFLWIIRTDKNLSKKMLKELKNEVRKVPNAVLIGSNEDKDDIRNQVKDVTKKSVLAGSYDLVMSYHAAAQTRPVMETRLDADDALSLNFIESIQTRAAEQIMISYATTTKDNNSRDANRDHNKTPSWMVLCPFDALEWHLYNPMDQKSNQGVVKFASKRTCITPGLTYLFHLHATKEDIPTRMHDALHKVVPACRNKQDDKCLHSIKHKPNTTILRARTPTSAGMHRVITSATSATAIEDEGPQFLKLHKAAWADLKTRFAINVDELVKLRSEILNDLPAIAEDNMKGQCTRFHSCKESTKQELEQLRATYKKQKHGT